MCKPVDGDCLERIPAHKSIFMQSSKIFNAMFSPITNNDSGPNKSTLREIEYDSMKEFLQFLNLSKGKLTVEKVAEVVNLGWSIVW